MNNLAFANEEVITSGQVNILSGFLQSRKLQRIDTPSDRVCFRLDRNKPIIRIANGSVHEYPVRRSMVDKLLRWHHIDRWMLNKASNETAISFLNDLLLSIKSSNVRIYVENGDAKTITSNRYTEFFDDEVLKACADLKISTVSRTDKVLRIDSVVDARFQPAVGDDCGFGFTIFNSETGFHSLQISHYILRYVCSNGLIIKIPSIDKRLNYRNHYNLPTGNLKMFLENQLASIKSTRRSIIRRLERSTRTLIDPQLQKKALMLLRKINVNADMIRNEVLNARTEWELVNVVTAHARQQPVDLRLMLEQSAGRLFQKVYEN